MTSGNPKSTTMWTPGREEILRTEVEHRFRLRTPAKDILDVDWRNRVPGSEMLEIARDCCGMQPPLFEREWLVAFYKWYIRMAKKNLRELDQDWVITLDQFPPSQNWAREE